MRSRKKVSVIVPAYNEEQRVRKILHTVKQAACVGEVICVNDGSTDNTLAQIKKVKGILCVNLAENKGKGGAVAAGLKKAKKNIVAFIDADLKGLRPESVDLLVRPLLEENYDVSIGYKKSLSMDELFRPLSGERAYFRKDLLPFLKEIEQKGYGLELFLNHALKDKKVKIFELEGVKNTLKYEKQSYDTVAKLTLIESKDIIREILKQDNPLQFMLDSYFYSFYIRRPVRIKKQISKLRKSLKKFQNEILEQVIFLGNNE